LGAKQANIVESHTGNNTLQITGLKSSKAAANPDGGLESLLSFLERKASGTVKIKKVC
jgi:nuclear RNA export factor